MHALCFCCAELDVEVIGDSVYLEINPWGADVRVDRDAMMYITLDRTQKAILEPLTGMCGDFDDDVSGNYGL